MERDHGVVKASSSRHDTASRWYEENAERFADAEAIEQAFLGMAPDGQHRLNQFKLEALAGGRYVSLAAKQVLDFGAGHGRLALAHPEIARYTGVDASANLVAVGQRRLQAAGFAGRAQLLHGDVHSFDSPPDRYDVVCALGMFPYIDDPTTTVVAMARHLKPGGDFFVDFRNNSWLMGILRRIKWLIKKPTAGVSQLQSHAEMTAALEAAGLTNIRFVAREFPLLAGLHARFAWSWPRKLRNLLAIPSIFRVIATESWVFATKTERA